jgi:DNA-binding transcriptional ArsR family regulator
MNQLEKIFKALANRRRLAIVRYLKNNNEATVGAIAREIRLSLRATSRHLGKLAACDILEREQRSLEAYYRLAQKQTFEIRKIISTI